MMDSMHRKLGALVFGALCALASPAVASPPYARDPGAQLLAEASQQPQGDVVPVYGKSNPPADSPECVTDLDIVNRTPHVRWGIVVRVEQRFRLARTPVGPARTTRIQIPYLPAHHAAAIRIPCISRFSSVASYDEIWSETWVTSLGQLEAALPWLAATHLDNTLSSPIEPRPAPASHDPAPSQPQTVLDAALAFDDADVAHDLVTAIVEYDVGVKALIAAVNAAPQSHLAQQSGPLFGRLPANARVAIAWNMLQNADSARQNESLLYRQLAGVCVDRSRAIGLWLASRTDSRFATPRLRRAIALRCRPGMPDLDALTAALAKQPAASTTIDDLDPAVFTAAVARWRTSWPGFVTTYLAGARDAARFEALIDLASASQYADLVAAFARSEDRTLHDQRLDWVRGLVSNPTDRKRLEAIARALFELDATNHIDDPDYAQIVHQLRTLAPEVDDEVRWTLAGKRNSVFDVTQLASAHIDRDQFTAYVATGALDHCQTDLDALLRCARSIHQSSVSGLNDLVATAVKPELTGAIHKMFGSPSTSDIITANELVDLGWDLRFLANDLCTKARASLADSAGNLDWIARARQLELARDCVQSIESSRESEADAEAHSEQHREIAGIVGMILPLAIGLFVAIRWIRQRPAADPGPEVEAPAVVARDTRLGAYLKRGLAAGAARARLDLSIAAVDDGILDHVVATVRRAVAAGVAASRLIRDRDATFYIVALPVGDAPSEVVQRHLGAPWPEHMHQVHLVANAPVTALIVLCGPEAMQATLLVSHTDGTRSSDPDAVLDARDARAYCTNSFCHAIPLSE